MPAVSTAVPRFHARNAPAVAPMRKAMITAPSTRISVLGSASQTSCATGA